jgi:hypothetical protein
MSDRIDKLRGQPGYIYEDLALMLLGEYLGGGIERDVFALRLDPKNVIKLAQREGYQNIVEFEVWRVAQDDKELKRWFAPVTYISGVGQWLIQERTTPILLKDLPKKVPNIFADLKPENWGWLDGRPVCHDYGSVMCRLINSTSARLRVARWD